MQKIILPIDTKSLYYNILNDNKSGHTATVATPIKQGNSTDDQLSQLYKIPKQIDFQNNHELVDELLKNSKSINKINNVFVIDKISVNGIKIDTKYRYCIYVKEEIDKTKYQYGRISIHYPLSLKYSDENLEINNKGVLDAISKKIHDNAFIVNAFEYDFDSDEMNFDVTIVGENNIPYSKVFINNKGYGNKFSNIFNEYADTYDMEIISLKKKYGEEINTENYREYLEKEKSFSINLIIDNLKAHGIKEVNNIAEKYPYSLYDIEYLEQGIKKYIMIYYTSTSTKYFNMSSKRLKFLNDFREQAYILLITNVEENYNIVKYGMEDINKLSSTINSVMFKEV